MRLHVPHIAGHAHQEHHVRDALSAAGDASAEVLATLFTDTHPDHWEEAVRRYDAQHASDQTDTDS